MCSVNMIIVKIRSLQVMNIKNEFFIVVNIVCFAVIILKTIIQFSYFFIARFNNFFSENFSIIQIALALQHVLNANKFASKFA